MGACWENGMNVVLYHGSEKVIEMPVFGAGNPANDYGQGFYKILRKGLRHGDPELS